MRHCKVPPLDDAEVESEGQPQEGQEELDHFIRNGTGYCLDPVQNETDSALLTAVCFSPAMQLKPGQVMIPLKSSGKEGGQGGVGGGGSPIFTSPL